MDLMKCFGRVFEFKRKMPHANNNEQMNKKKMYNIKQIMCTSNTISRFLKMKLTKLTKQKKKNILWDNSKWSLHIKKVSGCLCQFQITSTFLVYDGNLIWYSGNLVTITQSVDFECLNSCWHCRTERFSVRCFRFVATTAAAAVTFHSNSIACDEFTRKLSSLPILFTIIITNGKPNHVLSSQTLKTFFFSLLLFNIRHHKQT